jgi:hypothetical protein
MTAIDIVRKRAALAAKFGFEPCPVPAMGKVGLSHNVRTGAMPINGVRCRPEAGTTGWYIWAGETMSEDPDFFEPLHTEHLAERCPDVLPFLELPPGWRFLVAPGYEDVWFDPDVDLSAL